MSAPHAISAELVAVIVSVTAGEPRVLTLGSPPRLPSGPFSGADRSLQAGLRAWVARQTGLAVGYVEQLYTFADADRLRPSAGDDGGLGRVISVSYLALAREEQQPTTAIWRDWYGFFPWEDRRRRSAHRDGTREADAELLPRLLAWAGLHADPATHSARRERVAAAFGDPPDPARWNEELALARYELLFEAGLVDEAEPADLPRAGRRMAQDHRRILATAIARLRAKVKYRALVFELMPAAFTLSELQRTMEALSGRTLHKQNFRRLIAQQDLVEDTGALVAAGRGRPAKLFRFRGQVVAERRADGTRVAMTQTA